MSEHVVADADELGRGERLIVQLEGREIAIFNVDGELAAYTNWCAHQGGPCGEGSITGTVTASFDRDSLETTLEWSADERILNCPWHGWEYDVTTGECLSRRPVRLPSHEVSVRDGEIVVTL